MRLRSLRYPYPSLHVFSLLFQPANRQSQRWMQLLLVALTLDGLDWTELDWALPRLLPPKGKRGLLPGIHVTRSLGESKVLMRVRL